MQQLAEELKQQLSAKGAELEEERNGRAAEASGKALEESCSEEGELMLERRRKGGAAAG